MSNVVAEKSRCRYKTENVKVLLWIYSDDELYHSLLKNDFVTELSQVEERYPPNNEKKRTAKMREVTNKW